MNKPSKKDDPLLILAIIIMNALAVTALSLSPVMVGEMVTSHGFSSAEAGYMISLELGAMALATLPAYYWISRVDLVKTIRIAIFVIIIGNLASAAESLSQADFTTLLMIRFLTGLANGSLAVIVLKTVSHLNNVTRGYALHALGEVGLGALGVATLPHLFAATGLYAAYLLMLLLALLSLNVARYFSLVRITSTHPSVDNVVRYPWALGALGLLGILILYAGNVGLWTYTERIGVTSGLSVISVGYILSAATIISVIGSLIASMIAVRVSHIFMTAFGLILVFLSISVYLDEQTLLLFLVATCMIRFSIALVLPFLLNTISMLDQSKRLVISLFLVIAIGGTAGPAISAALIGDSEDYKRVVVFALSMIGVSSMILFFVTFKARYARMDARVNTISVETQTWP